MIRLIVAFFLSAAYSGLVAQESFTHTFGGKKDEHGTAVVQTRDGGYAVTGFTYSYGKGKSDIWVMKLDAGGNQMWRKFIGTKENDWAYDLVETRDGNFVIAGHTRNSESGKSNAWVFQLNRHGEQMWSHRYGGEDGDYAKAVKQTLDGGFVVAGFTATDSKGKSDIWLLRLNATGDELWQKRFGGIGIEKAYDVIETRDEGFLIGGYQLYDREKNLADMLLVKTDRHGSGLWRRVIKNAGNDVVEAVLETEGGNYLAAGWGHSDRSKSLDGKLVKVSPGGKVIWEQEYGGENKDALYDLKADRNGGYMLVGQTASFDMTDDVWTVRVSRNGREIAQRHTKGDKRDYGRALTATKDGGFLLVGGTESYSNGGVDICLFKLDPGGNFADGPFNSEGVVVLQDKQEVNTDPGNSIYKPNLYILSVGVSSYEDPSVSLTYAHTDAAAVARKFASLEGKLFNKVEMKQFMNNDASLINIRTGISWLERQATQKDMILIFISAHGALDHKGNLYILPTDFDAHNLFATALNIRDLTEGMNGTPCKKLIFLDACHSGQSGYDLLEFASIKAVNLNKAVEELVNKEPGVTVMTSSSGKEFSYENPKWGHGAFTKAILEGLNGSADFNQDKVINLMELNLYVMERVKKLTDGRQHPYIPINLFGDIPLFILD